MATIRITGKTLQIDEAFYEEGLHQIDDQHLARLQGVHGVEVIEDISTPASRPRGLAGSAAPKPEAPNPTTVEE